jgi:hypothetical protein
MRKFTKKQYLVAGVAAAIIAGTAGSALAYWTSTGTGTGTGTTGSAEVVTINQTSTVGAMGPGVASQALSGTFTTAHPAYVGQVTATVTGTSNAGCTGADFTISQPTATNAQVTTGDTWSGGSIVFKNSTTVNQDACQGVTVNIGYTS